MDKKEFNEVIDEYIEKLKEIKRNGAEYSFYVLLIDFHRDIRSSFGREIPNTKLIGSLELVQQDIIHNNK